MFNIWKGSGEKISIKMMTRNLIFIFKTHWYMIKMGEFGAKINWGLGSILTWKSLSSGIYRTFGTTSLHLTLVSGSPERWLWASCLHEDCRHRRHRRSLASRRRLFGRRRIQTVNMVFPAGHTHLSSQSTIHFSMQYHIPEYLFNIVINLQTE